ncbi:hypothetical protein VN24_17925 [Paenibacillus beijingensis]|uniref:Uncharacterized protein n=2 Tax=Paenibacillus beijingensis TaxID=1126833 RepID=A0A0D5NRB1_9BACL|nr:hypothetical protein VN24_17925 [Paenibacillus beijingensis]
MQHDAKAESVRALIVNTGLALFKGTAGWFTGSGALLADGFRSASEACASYARAANLRSGGRHPADKSSAPRTEAAANLILAVLLLIVGLEIGISAVRNAVYGLQAAPDWYAAAAVPVAFVMKAVLVRDLQWKSEIAFSAAALLGAGGAQLGQLLQAEPLYYLDPAGALFIAVLVIRKGCKLAIAATRREQAPSPVMETADELMEVIQRVEGVVTVEALKARESGHYIVADIVISVNPRITVLEGNEIAKRVKLLLMKRFLHLAHVHVYVEPYDPGYPYKSNHDPNQEHSPSLLQ